MKLQLDERTLNAYINEALKRELLEDAGYRVNFDKMGKPAEKRKKKGRVKKRSEAGKYGKRGIGGQFVDSTPLGRLLHYGKLGSLFDTTGIRNETNATKIISDLSKMGYSKEQIADAIRNGYIESGDYRDGQFFGNSRTRQRTATAANLRKGYRNVFNEDFPLIDTDKVRAKADDVKTKVGQAWDDIKSGVGSVLGGGMGDGGEYETSEPEPQASSVTPGTDAEQPTSQPTGTDAEQPTSQPTGSEGEPAKEETPAKKYPWDDITQEEIDQAKREQQAAREAWLKKQQEKKAAEQAKAQAQTQGPTQPAAQSEPQPQAQEPAQPVAQPEPQAQAPAQAPTQPAVQPQTQQTAQPRQRMEPIAKPETPLTKQANPGINPQSQPTISQSAVDVMNQTANSDKMTPAQRRDINARTKWNTYNALDTMRRNGAITRDQARASKNMVRDAEKALRKGQQ